MDIKVSIIIPVYKVTLEYLRECFDSLLAQTMQECEFIVVSDGAPEAECSICEEYTKGDSRFKFFKREHAGVSATRNYGINQANGKYISFLDSDDWLDADYVDKIFHYAETNKSDILFCGCCLAFGNKQEKHQYSSQSIPCINQQQKEFIIRNIISTLNDRAIACAGICSKLYKKELFEKHSFSNLSFAEDRIINYSLFSQSSNICYLSDTFYYYRQNPNSVSHNFSNLFWEECLKYLLMMDSIISSNHKGLLNREAIQMFYKSWHLCYMNKKNPASFFKRMKLLCSNISQLKEYGLLKNIPTEGFSILVKIELFLFQRNITFPIWIHGLKQFLSTKIKCW